MKVLNLYAGIGGNRKLWKNVNVTAVEISEEIAGVYKSNFPNDEVIVGDAHQYLLLLRNCIHPKIGAHIFHHAFKEKQVRLIGPV